MSAHEFAWPDHVDKKLAEFESRIAALEHKVGLLIEINRNIQELLEGMREAVEGPSALMRDLKGKP